MLTAKQTNAARGRRRFKDNARSTKNVVSFNPGAQAKRSLAFRADDLGQEEGSIFNPNSTLYSLSILARNVPQNLKDMNNYTASTTNVASSFAEDPAEGVPSRTISPSALAMS